MKTVLGLFIGLLVAGCSSPTAIGPIAPLTEAEFSTPWSSLTFRSDSVFQGNSDIYAMYAGRICWYPADIRLALPMPRYSRDTICAMLGPDTLKIVMSDDYDDMPAGW